MSNANTSTGDEGFALYVHWPFCISKCPYCDFNSHVATTVDQGAWRKALLAELAYYAARTQRRTLTSIFFGGGTPSLMEPKTAAAIIKAAKGAWRTDATLEVTLEANPGTVDTGRFTALRDAGINRLSMGVQALNDDDLKFLGRKHGVEEARKAWQAAAKIFRRVSFDLIYARPNQTIAAWTEELEQALREVKDNGITHLSLYQLTMEEGTAMHAAHARGEFTLPNEDAAAALYETTQEICEAHGLPAYEISNHAADANACRHNLTYWRGGDYVGIGPGAHGRVTASDGTHATAQFKAPSLWLKKVMADGHATQTDTVLTAKDRAAELIMTGLRTTEGLNKARFERLAGMPLGAAMHLAAKARLVADRYLEEDDDRLTATPEGRLTLNAVLRRLLV
jgi:oxygen-independent coproporphyrinogen-3 oxidase